VPKSEVNALTLLAVFIAAGLSSTIAPERSLFAQPFVAVVLLIVLFSYDREGYRNMGQSLGFGAVAGYCVTRAILPVLAAFLLNSQDSLPWFSIVWIVATLILWAVDISRMSKRAALAQPYIARPATSQSFDFTPVPVREEPAPPQPAVVAPAPPVRPTSATSLFSRPPTPTPPHLSEEISDPVVQPPEPSVPLPAPPAPLPPPQAIPVKAGAGKPATIYLNLVGEGLPVLRSVQAEHVGKDYYLIVESVPPGETWQFQTGQVVRCQKRNLSNGKALVAVEEAPRAS
jgi:hypothetical protein